jgi:D-lactate dehydrogenase (cytochrome)
MLIKNDRDEIQSYLSDSSYMQSGRADRVVFPESAEDVAEILRSAARDKTPVTVSGAGTGTVGGRVPTAGIVLATDKLNHIRSIAHNKDGGGSAVVEAGVRLSDLQKFIDLEQLFYPPDPTERSCFLGGTVATNASGARTFKYGPTRKYVQRLKIVLATGDIINLRRGELRAGQSGEITIPLPSGRAIEARLPAYHMPQTRKHAAGYYVAPEMDLVDLFIGSEGTLGVVVEIEVALLPKPDALLSGVVFFSAEDELLAFVQAARNRSLTNRESRGSAAKLGALMNKALEVTDRQARPQPATEAEASTSLEARALEYFDSQSLNFLRQKYETIPAEAVGAVFFEQEITAGNDESLMNEWLELLEKHNALADKSWFATSETDQAGLREFRHALPVLMNEWFARHNQRKVSTDMSVPDAEFAGMLRFYQQTLKPSGLRYTIFGHIGDNHVHVNILPRNDDEAAQAREIYLQFLKRAAAVGGTLSAEHGIGKLKRDYLRLFYSEENLREMAALKRAFDPAGILGRGNIFSEMFLSDQDLSFTN